MLHLLLACKILRATLEGRLALKPALEAHLDLKPQVEEHLGHRLQAGVLLDPNQAEELLALKLPRQDLVHLDLVEGPLDRRLPILTRPPTRLHKPALALANRDSGSWASVNWDLANLDLAKLALDSLDLDSLDSETKLARPRLLVLGSQDLALAANRPLLDRALQVRTQALVKIAKRPLPDLEAQARLLKHPPLANPALATQLSPRTSHLDWLQVALR